MRSREIWVFAFVALTLAGCVSYPLPKIRYEKQPTVASDLLGSIQVATGSIQGTSGTGEFLVGGAFVATGGGNSPSWVNFNPEDQSIFANCLRDELQRLGIMKINLVSHPKAQAPVRLLLVFNHTERSPENDYVLEVTLAIQTPTDRLTKTYDVRAFEGESGWAKFNVTPTTGKKMAAQKLLNAMIPDIENAIRPFGRTMSE